MVRLRYNFIQVLYSYQISQCKIVKIMNHIQLLIMRMTSFNNWNKIVILLIILRVIIGWYGFDTLPLISNSDEGIIQDPAVSLSQGTGLIAPSFKGLIINDLYAHHPPIFIWIQAIIFRLLGFSEFSLRGLGVTSGFISIIILILVLRTLYQIKLINKAALVLSTMMVIFDPISLSLSRWGRMDSTANLFALLGILFLFKLYAVRKTFDAYYIFPAIFFGLSVSTHFQNVFYYVYFILFIFVVLGAIKKPLLLVFISILPLIILSLIWLIAFGNRSVDAIKEFSMISSYFTGGIPIEEYMLSLVKMEPQRFIQLGGTGTLIIFLTWLLSLFCKCLRIVKRTSNLNNKWLNLGIFVSFFQFMLLEFKFGIGLTRIYCLFPISVITLSICVTEILNLEYEKIRFRDWIVKSLQFLLGIIIFSQFMLSMSYSFKSIIESKVKNPNVLVEYVRKIEKDQKIIAENDFWFAFMKNKYPVRIVHFGFVIEPEYWRNNPENITQYDLMILKPQHPFFKEKIFINILLNKFRIIEKFVLNNQEYIVLKKFI